MGRLFDFLKRPFVRGPVRTDEDVDRLRIDFKARYHSFKLLLEANNKVLEIMAELGDRLRGTRPYGMTYVRARCTRLATRVWKMIKHLNELAPGKYEPLKERFDSVNARINESLAPVPRVDRGELVLELNRIDAGSVERVGRKMASLGEVRQRLKLNVPDGFVVTAAGFRSFMGHNELQTEIDRRLQTAGAEQLDDFYELSTEIQRLIRNAEIPAELEAAIQERYRKLEQTVGQGVAVAVRSSSLEEDTVGSSFAGQHHSELNVDADSLLDAYKMIVASKYSLPAMTYRLNRGIRDGDVTMCVGVMAMVAATAGGVAYTHNPVVAGDDSIIVDSTWGLPLSVVEGSNPTDSWVVARGTPLEIRTRAIADKARKAICSSDGGVGREKLKTDDRNRATLTDDQILELARLGLLLEEHYGAPQDIEWALDEEGRIILLQCRELELTQLAPEPAEEDEQDSGYEDGTVLLQGGLTASPGAAAGPVFPVLKGSDVLRFPEGAVLVTVQPSPLWAPLMSRAAAVVAEHGSVAGHLATVAREYRVPALFAAERAVERLPADEIVTVDAGARIVLQGRVEAALANSRPATSPMAGSPVQKALSRALHHVTPLNLLEPEGPDFRPQSCETFHDIARFCHERAVREMFSFGKDHHFPERSSKQLFCEVPMQWWVLNLDDGFKEEIDGKYVRLEEIASTPMLAIWEGIIAVPWEGPPPLDSGGFASVMLGATTDSGLAPGGRSRYIDRNYFMISKSYCCLNSRLGAHFSIVEALVGDRASENHVSFQFKGGAADFRRRLKRVLFVKEILEDHGFRVQVNDDNVIARLEGHEREFMNSRLKLLGYLNIHTRQLDMIMLNRTAVEHYDKKIRADIKKMLNE